MKVHVHLESMCKMKFKGATKLHNVENCDLDEHEHSEQMLY